MNNLWEQAVRLNGLRAGWHLTRTELARDFFADVAHQQAFGNLLASQLAELQRLVSAGVYTPRPLRAVSVPKGPLATRPGSTISIRDRVVLWSIVKVIAPKLYEGLSSSVYSYRLHDSPKRGQLFKEGDALSLPFLRGRDIRAELDPFEAWYALWPDFEARTKEIIGEGYTYLVVSDIAAYFENINLDLLRDQIMSSLGNEPTLANFVYECLRAWAIRSHTGSRPHRGIPQGSSVFSFFGNIYLMPIDTIFDQFSTDHGAKYIRYMDDIRIFCKDLASARRAAFLLEAKVRELHLNLQSAKTKILEEKPHDKQITHSLFDERVDDLTSLSERIRKKDVTPAEAVNVLREVARRHPVRGERLYLLGQAGTGLTDRALRMWMTTSLRIGDDRYIPTLLRQLRVNPDQRISKLFVSTCKAFPRKAVIGKHVVSFSKSEHNVHPAQEAELLRGVRYLSTVPEELWRRALDHVLAEGNAFQLRVHSLLLLGMRSHNAETLSSVWSAWEKDRDIIVHPYYVSVLGQLQGERRAELVDVFRRHANPHNHEFGLLLEDLESHQGKTSRWLDHIFRDDSLIVDWQGMLWFLARSPYEEVRYEVRTRAARRHRASGGIALRKRMAAIRNAIDAYQAAV